MDGARAATEWLQHHMHWNLIDGTTALRALPNQRESCKVEKIVLVPPMLNKWKNIKRKPASQMETRRW